MIVDSPVTSDLTLGQDKRIPEQADSQTVVPASVIPVVLALRPTNIPSGGVGVTIVDSGMFSLDISRTNQAAVTQALVTLAPGLWELEMTLATQFDYAGAVGTLNGADIEFSDSIGRTARVLSRFAQVGTFSDFNRVRILPRNPLNVNLTVSITAVGQHLDARVFLNCIRII